MLFRQTGKHETSFDSFHAASTTWRLSCLNSVSLLYYSSLSIPSIVDLALETHARDKLATLDARLDNMEKKFDVLYGRVNPFHITNAFNGCLILFLDRWSR